MNILTIPVGYKKTLTINNFVIETFDDKHERNLWLKRENISLGESSLGFFCVEGDLSARTAHLHLKDIICKRLSKKKK